MTTTDYPSFTSQGTQTRTYRLGDILRESKQENELGRLYSEREQILGRRAKPDPTPAIFSSQPPTTSLYHQ